MREKGTGRIFSIYLNDMENEIFSAQAREENRTLARLLKYATMQYCKSCPALVDKNAYVKFKSNHTTNPTGMKL
ncbi:MAG: hypothetical protein WC648_05195 [Candidatus Paceibacterota bacterium]|jgi:hypothetical protein